MSRRSQAPHALHGGFTLLELLVAMFIAAVIFAMGYGAINQAVKNRVGLQEQQAKLLELQTAVRVIEQDLVQAAPRPIRQPVGQSFYPALMATAVGSGVTSASSVSSASGQPVFSLTRAGWENPNGAQRPGLQRVAYYFDKGTLRREYWTVLDPTQTSTTVRRDLMTHLKSVSLRFYSAAGWDTQWPRNPALDLNTRPIAVEVTLETEDWGKIVRLIELPG